MAVEIPSPEEITRVTEYLQEQASGAQEQIIAKKQADAAVAEQAAIDLIAQHNVSGVVIGRTDWDDQNIPWQKRGDITSIKLDFTNGDSALVTPTKTGDGLDLIITPGSSA